MPKKNWSNDECFLAVWGYDRLDLSFARICEEIYNDLNFHRLIKLFGSQFSGEVILEDLF